jgi:outer membrane murein-binding lipoprotein Lpp
MTLQKQTRSVLDRARWALPVLVASSLLLAACGSSSVKGTGGTVPLAGSHTNLAASWTSIQDGSSAALITWTVNGHSASGNLTESSLDQTGLSVDSNTYAFTGTISGSSLTLNFSGGSTVTGSVSTSQLQLQIADSAGTVQSFDFTPGTTGAYNAAVKSIQVVVNTNEKTSTQEGSINNAAESVSADVSSIDSDISNLKSSIPGLESDLNSTAGDVQMTKNDAAVVTQDVNTNDNEACGDADSVQGDADSVQGDMDSLQGDEQSTNYYLTSLKSVLFSLPSDWSTYQQTLTAMPNYQSQYAVSSSQEQSALSQGASESSQFTAKESQVTASEHALVNEANQIATNAQTEANNGSSGGC